MTQQTELERNPPDLRDSLRVIQQDRKRKMAFAAAAVIGSVLGLGVLTYMVFNTESEAVRAVDAENAQSAEAR